MAREEFIIRITKKGEIIVETGNLPPQRVKDLVKYFEETIGPGRLLEADAGGASGHAEIDLDEEESEEVRERPRIRIIRD